MGRHISFPVGRVEYMALNPCTFEEFLMAIGQENIAHSIAQIDLPKSLHSFTMDLFKKFMVVGGLPEAVANYARYQDYVKLNEVFNSLLTGYRDDIEKYANKPKEQDAIRNILNYGWTFAGHRIQFAKFTSNIFKSADISNAFRTLEKTLLLELTYPQVSTSLPILPDLRKSPKLFWLDTGLMNYVAGMQEEMLFNADADQLWNGDIAEHIVAQELLGSDFSFGKKRMFWVRDAKNSQAEVDFLIQYKGHLIPIEVKNGNNSKLKSLHIFMANSKENIALRLWNGPMTLDTIQKPNGESFTLYNIPIYYTGHLEAFLQTII